MKIEDEMKFAKVDLNIAEKKNFTFTDAVCKIYVTFFLFPNHNSHNYNDQIY